MGLSFSHLAVVLLIILVLFGAGKLPQVMSDLGKGIRSLRDGMKGEGEAKSADAPKEIEDKKGADS